MRNGADSRSGNLAILDALRGWGRIGIAAGCLMILAIIAFAWTIYGSSERSEQIAAEIDVINESERLLSMMASLESSERGYVLTGTDEFLEPYRAAIASIDQQFSALEAPWAASDADEADLTMLREAVAAETAFATEVIRQRAELGFEPAAALVQSGQGKQLMDAIRLQIASIQESAEARIDLARQARGRADLIGNIAFLLAVLAGAALATFAFRRQRETKRTAAALDETNLQFKALADNIPQLAWTAQPSGEIFWYNKRWFDYTGTTLEDMKGFGWRSVHHPDHVDQVTEGFKKRLAEGENWEDTFPLRGADGSYRWFLSQAVPIRNEKGKIVRWFGTNTDVTRQRDTEQELAAAKELAENANRAKSQFIANMSHELRTPLTAVIGYAEMLEEEVEDLGIEHLQSDLKKIEGNARHLLSLINNVLDLSKIEAERMDIFPETFDTKTVLEEVASTVGSLMEKKDNRLVLDMQGDLGQMHSDQVKLRQCLINLLSNAAKFTESGTITLNAFRSSDSERDWLNFDVVDSGIGMSHEQVEKLFERFAQADASTTRKFGGTGLGLAITRAFCRLLGGDIGVTSKEGEGSTFTIRIPAEVEAPAEEVETAPLDAAERAASSGVVLAVDDDPHARELIVRFLSREGFSVRTASDGLAGLEQARLIRPDVILLDVTMPKMDGWSVLTELKADPDLSRIPVVMVTILDEHSLGYALGASDYLQKPVEWDQLRQVMKRYRTPENALILAIDDDEDTLARTVTLLEREKLRVITAANGRIALDLLDSTVPNLILLDLVMPEMDGFAFLRSLRQRPAFNGVPVVVLTSKDLTRDEYRRLRQDADEIIAKGDVDLKDLAAHIRTLVKSDDGAMLSGELGRPGQIDSEVQP